MNLPHEEQIDLEKFVNSHCNEFGVEKKFLFIGLALV